MNLLDGQKTVKEVAAMLDFKQPSHFSRQFREFYGINPNQLTRG
jgi:AraC-like DNA-binding protein